MDPSDGLDASIKQIMSELEAIAAESASASCQFAVTELSGIDAGIYCLLDLFLAPIDRWKSEGIEAVWPAFGNKTVSPTLIFASLLISLANSAVAARKLSVSGFDRQARTVFRELIETSDILIVFLGDEDLRDVYFASAKEDFAEAYKYWSKNMRPSRIRERLEVVLRTIPGSDISERFQLYSWLSKAAHVDYTGLMLSGIVSDADGVYNFNIGGSVGPQTLGTLSNLAAELGYLVRTISALLIEKHGWNDRPDLSSALRGAGIVAGRYGQLERKLSG